MSNNVSIALYGQDVSLSSVMAKAAGSTSKAAGQMESAGGRIRGALGGAFTSLSKTGVLGEYGETLGTAGDAVEKFGEHQKSMGTKLLAGGGSAAAAGVGMSTLASKDQAAQQQLAAAIDQTGGSFEDYKAHVEHTIRAQEKYGHTADQTQQALATLTAATGSPSKALANMGLVANLAASRHESLTTAADQVSKIMAGKGGKTLATYGITMKQTGDKTKDAQDATDQLAQKLTGQASAAADTFTGKLDAVKTRVTDVASKFAEKLGPALTIAGPAISTVGAVMEIMATRAGEAAVAEGGMAVASEAAGGATLLAFGPILLVLAAVGVAAYLLYKHWDAVWGGIKAATSAALGFIKHLFSEVMDFVTSHWKLFAIGLATILLGPVGGMVVYVATHFGQIKTWIGNLVGWFTGLPGKMKNLFVGMFDGIADAFKAPLNLVIGWWDDFISHLHLHAHTIVPGTPFSDPIKSPDIDLGAGLHIPKLAKGGLVKRSRGGTLALLGEGRYDERVTPLDGRENGGGELHVHLHTNAVWTDGRDAAAFMDRMIIEAKSMGWVPTGRGLQTA